MLLHKFYSIFLGTPYTSTRFSDVRTVVPSDDAPAPLTDDANLLC
jgi:hypothetical protein